MNIYNPKVSIVIPAYNASNYLAEAIESALAQTYKNIEIIVVNDGSKDNGATAEVAVQYGDKIRYFEKENGGSSSALNYGIHKMKGEWFSWLSHDDLYYPEKIKKQIECISRFVKERENPATHIAFAACDLIDSNGQLIRKTKLSDMEKRAVEIENMKDNGLLIADPRTYSFNGCSCLIHKTVFERIGYFDETLRLINDLDMWYRIFAAGYKIHFVPDILVRSRIHEKQVSHTIGYSTQNPEQTFYLNRSMNWLLDNCPQNEEALYRFAKMTYLGQNIEQGEIIRKKLQDVKYSAYIILGIKKYMWISYSKARKLCKKIYLIVKGNKKL